MSDFYERYKAKARRSVRDECLDDVIREVSNAG